MDTLAASSFPFLVGSPAAAAAHDDGDASSGRRAAAARPLSRVLVVDDEEGLRDLLAFELSQEGFEVVTAASGLAGVELVRRRRFEACITDLKMPGMDGLQTLAAMKEIDPQLEIIVATGYASIETAIACMKAGAYDYVQKPYSVAELGLQLRRAIEKRRLERTVTLYEVSRTLLTTPHEVALVEQILGLGEKLLAADAVVLALGATAGAARCHERGGGFPDGFARRAARHLWNQPPEELPLDGLACGAAQPGDCSGMAYPLEAAGRRLGAFLLLRRAARPGFSEVDARLGGTFAVQIVMALENARLYGELEHRAATDELTGLYSRRFLVGVLQREIKRVARSRAPLSCLVMDVDHFKRINDTLGHAAGDQVLRELAGVFQASLRETDVVGRLGGEEFVALLPDTGEEDAVRVAERLRAAVARPGRSAIPVTISIGVAALTADAFAVEDGVARLADRLLSRADQALYRAKHDGRDRVCRWTPAAEATS